MKIERKELLTALEPLKPALAVRSSIAELSHVWFDREFAYAYDNGKGIRVKFACPLKLGVSGPLLLGLVEQSSADTFTLEENDTALTFKSGRSNVKLVTLPFEGRVWPYPEKSKGKPLATIKVSEGFLAALKRVLSLRPVIQKRMEHHSVCVYPIGKSGEEMDLFTTDSVSLAYMPLVEAIGSNADALAIPREFADQILAQCKPGQELNFYTDHFALQASEKVWLYSNVFDTSEMLELGEAVDKFSDKKLTPTFDIPDGFTATLERAVLMAGTEEPVVSLRATGKTLVLKGQFKFGQLDEEFTLSAALPKVSIDVVAKTLLAVKDVTRMMILPRNDRENGALALCGKDGFRYITAPWGMDKKSKE
jgi:hypothetical protein